MNGRTGEHGIFNRGSRAKALAVPVAGAERVGYDAEAARVPSRDLPAIPHAGPEIHRRVPLFWKEASFVKKRDFF